MLFKDSIQYKEEEDATEGTYQVYVTEVAASPDAVSHNIGCKMTFAELNKLLKA